MRELTFLGFLTRYVRQLSLSNTNGLYKLAQEASTNNPRLREPLFLYALYAQKTNLLLQAAKDEALHQYYQTMLNTYSMESISNAFTMHSTNLAEEYHKVWKSYLNVKNRNQADNHTKELMRNKVKRLQEQHKVTNYRIYTDLKLNPGNLNAWLKHGNCDKVSLDVARQTLRYVENIIR